MQMIGPIEYTADEMAFAQGVNDGFPGTNADYIERAIEHYKPSAEIVAILYEYRDSPLVGRNFPALDEKIIGTGSTDVGDLSQIVPVSMLSTVCFPTGCPGHSWGNTAAAGMSIGHKGMLHAAKIMAVTAAELYTNPDHLTEIRQEFERATRNKKYVPSIPENLRPPRYDPEGKL
jgi:aminobenzoyl-glutamate utilization protein B